MAIAADLPFSKISIPGPTIASLLHHSLSSSSVAGGLLFGHVTRLPSPEPTDADPTPSSSSPSPLSLIVTSFLSSSHPLSFFDSLALIDPTSPLSPNQNQNPNPNSYLVGWFSSRPCSPLRPSMRELAVAHHLSDHTLTLAPGGSLKACLFMLLSSFSTANQAVHTHAYRAFILTQTSVSLRPVSVDVINVGPKFRGQYWSFSPESSVGLFPMVPCRARVSDECVGEGFMETQSSQDCQNGDWGSMVEGFGVEGLEGLAGERAAEYSRNLEELYGKMMGKLEGLVMMVEASSAKVQEQESRNSSLRNKLADLE